MRIKVHRTDRSNQGLFWLSGFVFLVSAVLLVFLVYLWLAGPREIDRIKSWEVDETSIIDWMTKSVEAEETFEREWKKDPDKPGIFEHLEDALNFQRKLKAVDPDDSFGSVSRLTQLLKRLEETRGKLLYTRSRALTNQASEIVAQGDSLSAMPLLEEALADQEWINAHLLGSSLVDPGEATRIRKMIERLETVDTAEEIEKLTAVGHAAYAAGKWDEAAKAFQRALILQESINLNMPESSHVRWRLVQELKDFENRIEAARMNQRIEELMISASDEKENLERSLQLQALLNERYPNTEFYNADRLKKLRQQLASDQSEASAALLREQVDRLDALLREKNWQAVHVALLEIEESLNVFESRYSVSLLPDPTLKARVDWLIQQSPNLVWIHNHVYEKLVIHPALDIRICNTEVDQALYEILMGSNPSRWVGENYPVDSVGFEQAVEFCNRLGWALGRRVTLPSKEWFNFIDFNTLRETELWFAQNSQFRSQPTGTSGAFYGFYDVYGNLAEWIMDSEDSNRRALFGGSGADTWEKVKTKSVNWVAPNFRSRWAGFRFCVLNPD